MKRIQRKQTKGWRKPEGAVYVGGNTPWGNPYVVGTCLGCLSSTDHPGPHDVMTPEVAVAEYRCMLGDYRVQEPPPLEPLRDATALVCWCPEACTEDLAVYGMDPCTKRQGHADVHDALGPPYCHADVLIEMLEAQK